MTMPILAILFGLILLVWSADRFVDGAAAAACRLGMPSLLIGMLVVGFGTSAPELVVSGLAASQGNSGIALGNAFGSNITNIALILGLTAFMHPITVHSRVLRTELPILSVVTILAAWQLMDDTLSRGDAIILLTVFGALMTWTVWQGLRQKKDALGLEVKADIGCPMPLGRALIWLVAGLVLLVASSRVLVWGAIELARSLGIGDMLIGLTIVAIGTSLPELASSIIAARKGEDDIALGNILGSNLFNTLAVVGIAGTISPMRVPAEAFSRDILVMAGLTMSLFVMGYGFRGPGRGRINRFEGAILLACFGVYMTLLVRSAFQA